jgi:tetrahydromethanopterin S-methyltransferase subunit E
MNKIWCRRLGCILAGFAFGNIVNSFVFFDTHKVGLGVEYLVSGVLSLALAFALGSIYIKANKVEESVVNEKETI